jgi:cytoskeletal protein CcmA (bactofilin family)
MFSSSKRPKGPSVKPRKNSAPPSIISLGLTVTGNLVTEGDVQVEGAVTGDINAGRVTVGEGARIDGDISAEEVLVMGEVNGRLKARIVALTGSARVNGDVIHSTLSVDSGARVNGMVRHLEDPHAQADQPGLFEAGVTQLRPAATA